MKLFVELALERWAKEYNQEYQHENEGDSQESALPPYFFDMPIEMLHLDDPMGARISNCLKRNDINRIGDIFEIEREDLLGFRNLGKKGVDALFDRLDALMQRYKNGG